MQIDIPQTSTIGQRLGRVTADTESYVKSVDGSMRQALSFNDGFVSVQQLRHTFDTLGNRLDRLLSETEATARGVIAAAQQHSAADERYRCVMDRLAGQLTSIAPHELPGTGTDIAGPGEPTDSGTENPTPGGQTALASAPPAASSSLGAFGTISERAQTGLGRFGNVSSWMSDVHYGRFAPRGANGQFVSPNHMSSWQRAVSGANGEFRAIPHHSATRATWATAGTWAGRVGTGLNVVTKTADQAAKDWNNPNLTKDQKVARAGWRGAVEGGSAWGGGAAGAKVGAGLGTLVAPGIGTVVGGAVGGIIGGIAGSQAGQWIADRTVDDAGDIFERITPW